MLKQTVLAALAAFALSPCQAVLITQYDFAGSPGDQVSEAPDFTFSNLSASNITRGSGITASGAGDSISASGWTTSASLDTNDYYEFTLTVDPGYELTLENMTFDERRSGTGIRTFSLRSSLDSFGSDLAVIGVPDNTSTRAQDLSLTAIGTITTPITFRIYGYAAEGAGGTWRLSGSLDVNGTVAAVIAPIPEPTAALFGSLLACGLGLTVARRNADRD